ncbi:MAG: hypothetical protein LW817_01380 [Candidatus Caenarcaniphilales bacterium]|jgi:hypothetical protein|nr:hypothetical protein [Candidatus Caenarcaniphilales bacterium]
MAKGRHQSTPKELKKNFAWLENYGAKIIIGISECARHKYSPGTIKLLRETPAGFKANAYSGNGIMNIFIVTKTPEIRDLVKEKWGS